MKSFVAALLVAVSAVPASAAVLIGSATLSNANDLTVVQDGATTYEFLDLSLTKGLSHTTALAQYGGQGFTVARTAAISALFDAFGFSYLFTGGTYYITTMSSAEATNYIGYLGMTIPQATLGSFVDTTYGNAYTCVGFGVCTSNGFVVSANLSGGNPQVGVHLVRTAATAVPEPAMLGLFGLGALGLGLGRRRR